MGKLAVRPFLNDELNSAMVGMGFGIKVYSIHQLVDRSWELVRSIIAGLKPAFAIELEHVFLQRYAQALTGDRPI